MVEKFKNERKHPRHLGKFNTIMKRFLTFLFPAVISVTSFSLVGFYISETKYALAGYWFGIGTIMCLVFLAHLLEISNNRNK